MKALSNIFGVLLGLTINGPPRYSLFCTKPVSKLPEMAVELYSVGTHMRRYGCNKHTLEPSHEYCPYIEHLEPHSDTRRLSSIESG